MTAHTGDMSDKPRLWITAIIFSAIISLIFYVAYIA